MNHKNQSNARFLELIAGNGAKIRKICRVYAWAHEDREDLYQEILCRIWRALPTLKEQSYANTWLYRIALNTAISFVRKQKAHRTFFASGSEEKIREVPDTDSRPDPDARVLRDNLFAAISRLKEMEKAVITLYLEDLSYEQIATVTGISESHVGVTLHRAKKKLSTFLKEVPCRTTH